MHHAVTCTHCDAELSGPYCARCGQPVRTGRLTTPRVLREGLAEMLDLEAGLLPTIRTLVTAPERVVCGYWRGHTRPWVHPAKFFLLSFAVAQFVAWRTGGLADLADGFVSGGPDAARMSAGSLEALLAEYFVLFIGGGLVLPLLVGTVLGRRTLAEQTVFAAFVFGEAALLASLALLAGIPLSASAGPWVAVLSLPFYLAWCVRRVFDAGPIRTALATAGLIAGSLLGSTFIAGVLSGAARVAAGS